MNLQMLVFVKRLIGKWAARLCKVLPKPRIKYPVSLLVCRIFSLLREGLKLHPKEFYSDGNFPRFLDALERALVFIADGDPHYRGWLAEALLLTYYVVGETRGEFPAGVEGDKAWIEWASASKVVKVKRVK